jgi:Glycosyltransferase family 87
LTAADADRSLAVDRYLVENALVPNFFDSRTEARMHASVVPGLGRRIVTSLWAAVAMPYVVLAVVVPVARALGSFERVPIPIVAVLGVIAGPALVFAVPRLAAPLPESLDRWFDAPHRARAGLWAVGGLVAVLSVGRIAIFLGDPSQIWCSLLPSNPLTVHHSCVTAYVHAAVLSEDPAANAYDLAFVGQPDAPPISLPPTASGFAPFNLDPYNYPPPFLLLPRALLLATSDFLSLRMLFSAGSLLLTLFACAVTARTLGGVAEHRLWLLTPIFMAGTVVPASLQLGNIHLAIAALCLLAWAGFERRRDGAAGALLAAATLTKLAPGLLGVLLMMQKRWRAVAVTCLAAAILCALSVVVLGTGVWRDFLLYQLPHLQSGEAYRFLSGTNETSMNLAPFGIPFKLAALGFEGWGWPQARLVGNVATAALIVLAILAGRNTGSARHRLTVWLAIAMLGSLRSPFAAPYVLSTMVLLLLVFATEVHSGRKLAAVVALCVLVSMPIPGSDASLIVAASLVRAVIIYAFLAWVVLRREATTLPESRGRASLDRVPEACRPL